MRVNLTRFGSVRRILLHKSPPSPKKIYFLSKPEATSGVFVEYNQQMLLMMDGKNRLENVERLTEIK